MHILALDGDFLCRRWKSKQRLIDLCKHLYNTPRWPNKWDPPDAIALCLGNGTWRPEPYQPTNQNYVVVEDMIQICQHSDFTVIKEEGLGGNTLEAIDHIASLTASNVVTAVTDDWRMFPLLSANFSIYKPGTHNLANRWAFYSDADWKHQYGPATNHWPAYLTLIGYMGLPEQERPTPARRKCKDATAHQSMHLWDSHATVNIPQMTSLSKSVLIDLERVSAAMKEHDDMLFEAAMKRIKGIDPSKPTQFKPGTPERIAINFLRQRKELPLSIEGDAVLEHAPHNEKPSSYRTPKI